MAQESSKAKEAMELFRQGYNCAQAVMASFCKELGLEEKQAMMLASSFGGGMGRMREVCGAVSGMAMVLGLAQGYSDPKATGEKAAHYDKVQQLAEQFKAENGSIICRELLGLTAPDGSVPALRTEGYYKKRPCAELVADAAAILDAYIAEHPPKR